MIAIETKYIGPTNCRGSRIKASANGNHITIPYDYALSGAALHAEAAIALCKKMGWKGRLVSGGTDRGYVFTFAESEAFDVPE